MIWHLFAGGLDRNVLVLAEVDASVAGAKKVNLKTLVARQHDSPVGLVAAATATARVVPATSSATSAAATLT